MGKPMGGDESKNGGNDMSNPLVSVIIATYNYGHLIEEALASVSAQTYTNWECIVVDDGSTDDTEAIVAAFISANEKQSFRYISMANAGVSKARNVGIMHATGTYLQFLDADDQLSAHQLAKQIALHGENDCSLVFSASHFFIQDDHGRYSVEKYPAGLMATETLIGETLIKRLVEHNLFTISSALVRSADVKAVGMFDEINHNEDWLLWFKVALYHPNFVFNDAKETITQIRLHRGSAISNRRKMFEGEVWVRQQFSALLKAHAAANQLRWLVQYNEELLALHHIRSVNFKTGVEHVCKVFFASPFEKWRLLAKAGLKLMGRMKERLSDGK